MECGCKPQCMGMKYIIFGAILAGSQLWTNWDPWVVVGVLVILKGISKYVWPNCPCQKDDAMAVNVKKARR